MENMISFAEYAKRKNLSTSTLRRKAEKGLLKTAVKIGRNWIISADEEWVDYRRKEFKTERVPKNENN